MLFTETGLSSAEVTSLFVIWTLSSLLLEVPSGVLADVLSRRALLAIGPLLEAAGFALWVLAPCYASFAVGFVLWGACGALQSGAIESLVYDGLRRHGAAERYAAISGRAHAVATVAILAGMLAASPVFDLGGYPAVGAGSVAACLLASIVALGFPEHRPEATDAEEPSEGESAFFATLREGLRLVRRVRGLRHQVLYVAGTVAIWGALEELVPLLAADTGTPDALVPLLATGVSVGVAAGGLAVGPAARLGQRRLAAGVAIAGVAMAIAVATGSPWGFVAVAAGFGVFNAAGLLAQARLQDAITGNARATVTSLAGLGTDAANIAAYLLYAAASPFGGDRAGFLGGGLAYVLLGLFAVAVSARVARRSPAQQRRM